MELLSVRLCGQAQVITEPYVPNPCECGYQKISINESAPTNRLPAAQKEPA